MNGTWNLLASEAFENDLAPGSTHTLTAILSGSTIQALWDGGVSVLTVTNTNNIAATQYGVQWLATHDAVTSFDYFSVSGVLPTPAHHTEVTPGPGSVLFREGLNLTAVAKDASSATIPNTAFTWSTSNDAIATVTATSATTARVIGTGVGNVSMTATPTRGGAGSSAVTVNPGDFIIFDEFAGANATALAAHAPTVNLIGSAWAISGTPAPTLSGQAAAVASGSGAVTAMIDGLIPDVTVETDWTPGSSPAGGMSIGALVFRWSDANNYYMLRWANGQLILWRVMAGVWSNRWQVNFDGPILTGTHHLAAQATGSTIQVMWDRGVYLGTVSDNFNNTATQAGLQWSSIYDSRTTYDNFSIRGSLPPWANTVTVTPSPATVIFHEGTTVTAHAYDAVDAPITTMAFTWATSDANVFQVVPLTAATAFITAVGPGTATITATPTHGPSASTNATVNLGSYVVFDSFIATDGTLVSAHAPEVNQPGGAWSIAGSPAPSIAAQTAGVTAAAGAVTAAIEGWIADGTVSVSWTPGANPAGGSNYAGLVFRRTDANNYYLFEYWNTWLQLVRVTGGVRTSEWAEPLEEAPALQPHVLAAVLAGAAIQLQWDNGVVIHNVTSTFNINATQYGVAWLSQYDTTARYDNFSVKGTLPPMPDHVVITPNPIVALFHENTLLTATAYDASNQVISGTTFVWSSASAVNLSPLSATQAYLLPNAPGAATVTATASRGAVSATVSVAVDIGQNIVFDSFGDADGALLATHAPEVNQPGGAWVVTGGPAPTLSSQHAVIASGSSSVSATIEGWTPNVTVSVAWQPGLDPAGGSNYAGLIFRQSDANNYYLLQYWNRWLQLWRVRDGRWDLTWSVQFEAEPALQSHPIAVQLAGSQIQISWDNALFATLNDQFNLNATQYGLRWSTLYDATSTYDNFSIAGTVPPVPTTVVVTPTNPVIGFNAGRWAEAHAYDAVGTEIPGVVFRWASSAPSIVLATAQAANTGYLVGIGTGSSTITAQATRGGPTGSTTATVDLGSTLVYDSFQGSDGTNLTAHVPEVAQLGGSWTVTGGNGAALSGGLAVANATNSADTVTALFETSTPNGTLDVLWRSGASISSNAFGGVIFRATDSLNYFYVEYWGEAVYLWKRTPGGFISVARGYVGDGGVAGHHLGVTFVSATIQVTWDGVVLIAANDAFNEGATSAGLVWFPIYDPSASYDNFSITGTLPPSVNSLSVTLLQTSFAPFSKQAITAVTLDGSAVPITDGSVKFLSSDNSVATVEQTGRLTAIVTAIANGTATITASVPRGPAVPVAQPTTVSTCVDPLSASSITWDYQARTGASIAVTAPAGCSWTAFAPDSWITVTSGASGAGNRNVIYAFPENVDGERTGRLILGGRVYSIVQPAKPCHMDIAPSSMTIGSGGGTFSFDVSTTGSCAWIATVAQPAAWLHSSSSGAGDGTVTFVADPYDNTADSRGAVIHVGDAALTVVQDVAAIPGSGGGNVPPIPGPTKIISSRGATSALAVEGTAAQPQADVTWLTLTSDALTGVLTYTVAPAPLSTARTGHIVVGSTTLTIFQPASYFDAASGLNCDVPKPPICDLENCPVYDAYEPVCFDGGGGQVTRLGHVSLNDVDAAGDRIVVTTQGSESGTIRIYLVAEGGTPFEIDSAESEQGTHIFSFGVYLDNVRQGLYQKVMAGWEVPGTANANGCWPWPDGYNGAVPCAERMIVAAQTGAPTITGSNDLWWFNGATPAGYKTSVTLTSSGGVLSNWIVLSGSDKVRLSTTSGGQTIVTSTKASSVLEDIGIQVITPYGVSQTFVVTVRGPYRLRPDGGLTSCTTPEATNFNYASYMSYTVVDQFGEPLPRDVPVNEQWVGQSVRDYPGTNWKGSEVLSEKGGNAPGAQFADEIGGEDASRIPTPSCDSTNQAPSSPVIHWGQSWRVGSEISGIGKIVQTDTLQKLVSRALHMNIISPVP